MLCLAFCTCNSPSSMSSLPFTHCHSSPFLIGEDWTPHWPFCTCSGWSSTQYHSPPTVSITILSCFLLAPRPPFPSSYWLPDSAPSYTSCLYLHPLPTAIHVTLKTEAARLSKTLVSYCNVTYHHNPEDLNMNLHCCENLK